MADAKDIALVIGGSRGIGAAIVTRLAADGYHVIFTYNADAVSAHAVEAEVARQGGSATARQCDIGSVREIERILRSVSPTQPLKLLVNNAALWDPAPLETLTEDYFDRVISVNLKAPLFLAKYAVPYMARGSRMIFISSIAARLASPDYLAYAATKAGVNALVRGLAALLGSEEITVNALSPGLTDTDMTARMQAASPPGMIAGTVAATALGRMGKPSDIADAVALLARPDAGWITGQIIECTGGLML